LWLNFGRSSPRLKSAVTSEAGAYRISNLPAGDYVAAVIPATRATDWRDPDLLDTLSASASRISLAWGGNHTEELTINAR
jgi:hypothetical protein